MSSNAQGVASRQLYLDPMVICAVPPLLIAKYPLRIDRSLLVVTLGVASLHGTGNGPIDGTKRQPRDKGSESTQCLSGIKSFVTELSEHRSY